MADLKISQLTAASLPLAGTEAVPLVQSGATKKVAVASMFGTNVYTFLNTPSSANLAAALTDETGTGSVVFGTSPTIATPKVTGDTVLAGDPSNADSGNQRFRNINIGSISAGGNTTITVFPTYYRGFGSIDVNVIAYSNTDGSIMRAETQIFFAFSNNTLIAYGMKTPTYTQSLGGNDWRAGAVLTIALGVSGNNLTLTVTSTSGALTATRVMCQDFITTN